MATCNRILIALLISLCVATAAHAAAITVGWDANGESNLAGYRVGYGRTSGSTENVVDVGRVTSWTFTGLTAGTTYYFRVYAYNTDGEQSDASVEVSAVASDDPTGPALVTINRTKLTFGAVRSGAGATAMTPAQAVLVTQTGTTRAQWTVTSGAAWLRLTPAGGTGTGTFVVQLVAAALPGVGLYDGAIAVETSDGMQTLPVRLRVYAAGTGTAPTGAFDTPIDGTVGVAGAIPVTGWAIDDVEVAKVQIYRDPVAGEAGAIYIGDATFVAGARPDVEAAYSEWPMSDRAGWGFMLLTNMLPDVSQGRAAGGNGTFTLRAYAFDVEGQMTAMGAKTIAVNNRTSDKPFGTIDTPTQGGTASGSAFVNFGWAIAPAGTIPEDGSTITVLVDGTALGHPTFNNYRADIAAAFPGYANSNGAVGYYILDTTTLANGLHTISWVVTDTLGRTSGIGSRFFNVLNTSPGAARQASRRAAQAASMASGVSAGAMAELPVENATVELSRVAETGNAPESLMPEWSGEIRVRSREAEPLELRFASPLLGDAAGGTYEGFLLVNGEMRPLPAGSMLDAANGTFRWQPGAGFVGIYRLVFVHSLPGGAKSRIPVRVVIGPKFDRNTRGASRER